MSGTSIDINEGELDDVSISFKDEGTGFLNDIDVHLSRVMQGVHWLWRMAKKTDLVSDVILEKLPITDECLKVEQCLIKLSAYEKKDGEESLSVFQAIEQLVVTEEKNLQLEADRVLMTLSAEVLKFNNSSIPLALIKRRLRKIVSMDKENLKVLRMITQSEVGEYPFILTHHWDIYLPNDDVERQKLYQILAMSSGVYRNQLCSHKMASLELDKKRKLVN